MRHTISCLVRNRPGVLARIAAAFGERGVNIHSLAVNESDADNVSRITVVLDGEQDQLNAMAEQTAGLPDVVEVENLARRGFLDRELALVKVRCAPDNLPRLMQVCEVMRANVAALDRQSMTLEIAGDLADTCGIVELAVVCPIEQRIVGRFAPHQERHARRELERRQLDEVVAIGDRRADLDAI